MIASIIYSNALVKSSIHDSIDVLLGSGLRSYSSLPFRVNSNRNGAAQPAWPQAPERSRPVGFESRYGW